ncbi:MAG: caspase family protein, partial [Pyrinomonadaceae bacterium]|nr:caspase family protein [Pyrinomonadaceae bacterium]
MDDLTGKNIFRLRISSLLISLSLIFSILSPPAAAQTEPEKPRQIAADDKPLNQKRLALVIGNSDYKYAVKLSNAANDAIDMTAVLTKLGFEVISGVNQTKEQMKQSIRDFGDRLSQQQGIGLVFYAGHGVQS